MHETKRVHIAIAEDNHADIALVREALKIHRIESQSVVMSDGADVIQYFRVMDLDFHSPVPDLVLLDMRPPKCDGEEILKALRSTERVAQTPVVVMTSSAAAEVEKVARKHAALHYFQKPSTWEHFSELGRIVRTLLEGSKADRDLFFATGGPAGTAT